MSFVVYTDADIDDVIWNLNAPPRKCLGYRNPIEAFAANLGVALEM
jgi:transposase, IS30 family